MMAWSESIRTMRRLTQAEFPAPTRVDKLLGKYRFTNTRSEDDYHHTREIWKFHTKFNTILKQKYDDNGGVIFLAIKGQIEPCLCDSLQANTEFAAIEALQCPIQLLQFLTDNTTVAPPATRNNLSGNNSKQKRGKSSWKKKTNNGYKNKSSGFQGHVGVYDAIFQKVITYRGNRSSQLIELADSLQFFIGKE